MKNILFVMPILGLTGADRVIFTLLNNLDRTRFRPMLLLYKNDPSLNVLVKELRPDVEVTYLNISGRARFSFPKILTGIRRVCREKNVSTLFISSGTSNAVISPFLFMFGKRVKTIARESNLPSLFEKSVIVKFLYQHSYKNYDKIVAQSDDMREDLIKNFQIPADKIVKINNPLDYRYINALSQREGGACFNENKINLLSIGRLTYQKGFDLLLNEFAKVNDPRYHLTIIGEGEDKAALLALRQQLALEERVTFIDSTDNPYRFMRQADVFISSSRWEGYPNVVIESLLCGTPVLANNYPGGINEIIDSENGQVCDLTRDFSSALVRVSRLQDVSFDVKKVDEIFNKYNELVD